MCAERNRNKLTFNWIEASSKKSRLPAILRMQNVICNNNNNNNNDCHTVSFSNSFCVLMFFLSYFFHFVSFRFVPALHKQTNTLEEITTSPSSSQASAVTDILMTGNELMDIRESTTTGLQTTGNWHDCMQEDAERTVHRKKNNERKIRCTRKPSTLSEWLNVFVHTLFFD